ncbi:hypothetical protein VM1G_11407 [Cytospora mali]|uniref:Uncharacterized protein n=1 Tax=Cytospora mali TaxID=578113 RepID=A0A194VRP3_CYTMA|nr:hypothetical protein VM1G_11407 [Valsa mali]
MASGVWFDVSLSCCEVTDVALLLHEENPVDGDDAMADEVAVLQPSSHNAVQFAKLKRLLSGVTACDWSEVNW